MRSTQFALYSLFTGVLFAGTLAQAAAVTGTVTNKTTGKPSAGDKVSLVDLRAGMADAATAKTDAQGHYSLDKPGSGPYLVRATHQGASYFIAAPEKESDQGDIIVFDVKAKVDGVSLEDDILQVEAANGQISITEHFLIRNTSKPPVAQYSSNPFEFVLPEGAVMDGGFVTRPSGLPTMAMPHSLPEKRHYFFDVPIEPEQGENYTHFEVSYHLPYTGTITLKPTTLQATQNYGVQMPNSMQFAPENGATFQQVKQNSSLQSFLMKNVAKDAALSYTISGTGSLPREDQNAQGGNSGMPNQPGGGIGAPINTPDPLSKYKWWILGGLALLLAGVASFLLRKPSSSEPTQDSPSAAYPAAPASAVPERSALLDSMKEELFKLESEKLSGKISPEEYAEAKAAFETVLKRALKS